MLKGLQQELALVARAVELLQLVEAEEPLGTRHASTLTDYPKHRVRRSFQRLEAAGLLRPTDDGAVTTDRAEEFLARFDDDIDSLKAAVEELAAVVDDRR
ncbi:hypothetical protein [Haladaptatus salinisoli]|uniref:hypothetical protein n=1 Tax=Haladaptatus salinisoli TaxID=2884876 RepID=UPI001D0A758A|nr:hypothetical protein [Haladaptatus salinisoli]